MPRFRMMAIASAGLAVLLTAGCAQQSAPSQFFILAAPDTMAARQPGTTMRQGTSIGVGPVTLPAHLDRPQIMARQGATGLSMDEFNRWGGDLGANFQTVLAEVLSHELETDTIQTYPWSAPARMDYQILVTVIAFEPDSDGNAVLDARWTLVDSDRQRVLSMARSRFIEPLARGSVSSDYEAIAAALSANVASLGQAIAEQLRRVQTSADGTRSGATS